MRFSSGVRRLLRLPAEVNKRPLRNTKSQPPHLELLEDRVVPDIRTWTGASLVDPTWREARNWDQNRAPVEGDELVFPPGAQQLTNINNFDTGTHFSRITISGSGYHIFGQPINLDTGLAAS